MDGTRDSELSRVHTLNAPQGTSILSLVSRQLVEAPMSRLRRLMFLTFACILSVVVQAEDTTLHARRVRFTFSAEHPDEAVERLAAEDGFRVLLEKGAPGPGGLA
jgi:hypothetical protein